MSGFTRIATIALLAAGQIALTGCDKEKSEEDTSTDSSADTSTDTPEDTTPDSVPDTAEDTTPDTIEDTTPDSIPDGTTLATVSGTAGRDISTCPPAADGIGQLCMSLRTDCADGSTEVAGVDVAAANLSTYMMTVPFEIADVPDGTYQLYGILDDDASGCDSGATTGDFYSTACVEVTVAGGVDVTGVAIVFDTKCP